MRVIKFRLENTRVVMGWRMYASRSQSGSAGTKGRLILTTLKLELALGLDRDSKIHYKV